MIVLVAAVLVVVLQRSIKGNSSGVELPLLQYSDSQEVENHNDHTNSHTDLGEGDEIVDLGHSEEDPDMLDIPRRFNRKFNNGASPQTQSCV